jgi:ATP-dependent Clp protease ATP-binding subunit ClpC
LERRFQPVEVREPNSAEALVIVKGVAEKFKHFHTVEFTDAALEEAVTLTQKRIPSRRLPDKAIDAIDEAAAMVRVEGIHAHVPAILYAAAVEKYPELRQLWKTMQEMDNQVMSARRPAKKMINEKKRVEEKMAARGMFVVDSDDIRKVVDSWYT